MGYSNVFFLANADYEKPGYWCSLKMNIKSLYRLGV